MQVFLGFPSVLRLMNEHTATALAYGIYRSNDFDPESLGFNKSFAGAPQGSAAGGQGHGQ